MSKLDILQLGDPRLHVACAISPTALCTRAEWQRRYRRPSGG